MYAVDDDARGRKMTAKAAALARAARYFETGIMPAQNVLDDCEAEPDASVRTRPATINSKEPLGKTRNVFFGDSLTRVAHHEVRTACIGLP